MMSRPVRIRRDDTGEVFPSASEAGRHVGASAADICRSARTGMRVFGSTYSYAEARPSTDTLSTQRIWCVETGEHFSSASEAARMLGATRSQISRCARDMTRTVHGFHLSRLAPEEIKSGLATCPESGITRSTIRDAYEASGAERRACPPSLRGWADGGIHVYNPRARGSRPGISAKRHGRQVMCPSNGHVYPSIAAAASAAGVSCGSISRACDTCGLAGGLEFRWA